MMLIGGEESMSLMMEEGDATLYLKDNPHHSRFPSSKGENDPNIYTEWEQNIDQIFNIYLTRDQEWVDLVVLELEDYAMTWRHQLVWTILTKSHSRLLRGKLNI